MTRLTRAHTAAAVLCMTSVVLVPFGLWLYARLASVDRGPTVRRNERAFRGVTNPSGSRVVAEHSYPLYRWDIEGSLIPVDGYRTEFWLRLPRREPARTVVAHYVRELAAWRTTVDGRQATFVRGGIRIDVDATETTPGAQPVREYGVYVSQ